MEEQILKIMISEFAHLNMVQASKTAEKVTEHFIEFMRWLNINCYRYHHLWAIRGTESLMIFYGDRELYSYWNEHINNEK